MRARDHLLTALPDTPTVLTRTVRLRVMLPTTTKAQPVRLHSLVQAQLEPRLEPQLHSQWYTPPIQATLTQQ